MKLLTIEMDEADARQLELFALAQVPGLTHTEREEPTQCCDGRVPYEEEQPMTKVEDCPRCDGSDPDGICRHQEAKT